MLWTVDPAGLHRLRWEIPLSARPGRYRLVVTAKRYRLVSRTFRVRPRLLELRQVSSSPGRVALRLAYPAAVVDEDLTFRPPVADGGRVRYRVGSTTVKAKRRRGPLEVRAPSGTRVTLARGAVRDRFGNRNGEPLTVTVP